MLAHLNAYSSLLGDPFRVELDPKWEDFLRPQTWSNNIVQFLVSVMRHTTNPIFSANKLVGFFNGLWSRSSTPQSQGRALSNLATWFNSYLESCGQSGLIGEEDVCLNAISMFEAAFSLSVFDDMDAPGFVMSLSSLTVAQAEVVQELLPTWLDGVASFPPDLPDGLEDGWLAKPVRLILLDPRFRAKLLSAFRSHYKRYYTPLLARYASLRPPVEVPLPDVAAGAPPPPAAFARRRRRSPTTGAMHYVQSYHQIR